MPDLRETICITCGQALGEIPRLNRLEDGRPCPSCRDRLLEILPPALPAAVAHEVEVEPDHGSLEGAEDWMEQDGSD